MTLTTMVESQPLIVVNLKLLPVPAGIGVPLKLTFVPLHAWSVTLVRKVSFGTTLTTTVESQPFIVVNLKLLLVPAGMGVPLKVAFEPLHARSVTLVRKVSFGTTLTTTVESQPFIVVNLKLLLVPAGIGVPLKVAFEPLQARSVTFVLNVSLGMTLTMTVESQPFIVVNLKLLLVPAGMGVPLKLALVPLHARSVTLVRKVSSASIRTVTIESIPRVVV